MLNLVGIGRAVAGAIALTIAVGLSGCGSSTKHDSNAARTTGASATSSSPSPAAAEHTTSSSTQSTTTSYTSTSALMLVLVRCLRAHGYKIPNSSVNGSQITGIDTSSPRYQRIGRKCLHQTSTAK